MGVECYGLLGDISKIDGYRSCEKDGQAEKPIVCNIILYKHYVEYCLSFKVSMWKLTYLMQKEALKDMQ